MADVTTQDLVTYDELGKLIGVHRWTVRKWVDKGYLPPAVARSPRGLLFPMPSAEQIAQSQARKRQNEANRLQNLKVVKPEGAWLEKKMRRAPEGCVTHEQAMELLGCSRDALKKRIQHKTLRTHSPGWISLQEIERYKSRPVARRGPQKGAKYRLQDSPKPKELKIVPERPCSLPVAPEVPKAEGFAPYDTAVAIGRSNNAFQGALGFNLWKHPRLGFRPEAVNVKPAEGWHYHERHAKNGRGQWVIRAQKPVTGEILL